ncbi:MAG TPA: NifB/NifX family molybdenum-iron cluster-binding protein [Spirochaetales bacterium]|nr:NifB/NifX family molybdenum-iron cluster-binding protein [Spirochaetales bacterium]
MPRPVCGRRVGRAFQQHVFKPAGIPARELEELVLGLDQAEALRLADLEGMYQEAAARRMGISRQTFGRIVESARRIVADAIINGKALRLEGGEIIVQEETSMHAKIALPTRNGRIDEHFGHCDYFTVFEIKDGAIAAEKRVDSPDGCGCKTDIASVLARDGVTLMLAGNMGEGAVRVLKSNGIEVVRGTSGPVREVAQAWLAGSVKDSGQGCTEHGDHGCNG